MVSVLIFPASSLLAIPTWLVVSSTIAGLGFSAWISGVLPKHPKLQRIVVAFALAWTFVVGLWHLAAPATVRLAVLMSDQCWVFCWLDWF